MKKPSNHPRISTLFNIGLQLGPETGYLWATGPQHPSRGPGWELLEVQVLGGKIIKIPENSVPEKFQEHETFCLTLRKVGHF